VIIIILNLFIFVIKADPLPPCDSNLRPFRCRWSVFN